MSGVEKRFSVRRLVISLLVAASLAGIWFAFVSSEDAKEPLRRDAAVEREFPEQNSLALRQSPIGVDLAPGFAAVLYIDGVAIPEDQLDVREGLNEVTFTPGAGKEIEELAPGTHVARAVLWDVTLGREKSRPFSWRFNVH